MLHRFDKLICVTLALLLAAVAEATPTTSGGGSLSAGGAYSDDAARAQIVPDAAIIVQEGGDSHLAAIADEFLKPPTAFAAIGGSSATHTKTLPAVPAAVLMVLTGFFCVSLVKDRRVWLAALAGLLWLGQQSMHAIPHVAVHLAHRSGNQSQLAALCFSHQLESYPRWLYSQTRAQYSEPLSRLYAVVPEQYSLNLHLKCLAFRAGQFVRFSPAFIFQNLPRGPPELA